MNTSRSSSRSSRYFDTSYVESDSLGSDNETSTSDDECEEKKDDVNAPMSITTSQAAKSGWGIPKHNYNFLNDMTD